MWKRSRPAVTPPTTVTLLAVWAVLLVAAGLPARFQTSRPTSQPGANGQPETTSQPGSGLAAAKRTELLSGPPVVSAKAWAIGDARTGKLLWGSRAGAVLPIASTTKLMTAYLVAQRVHKQPKLLEETVTISAHADATTGSSAKLRAGERIRVGELLYGLLLPSGNDAANAFAEYFGGQFAEPSRFQSAADRTRR